MQGSKIIRVYIEDLKRIDRLNCERPQDFSRADTIAYILNRLEEYGEFKNASNQSQ
jgi:hypothetical protein